MCIAPQDAVYDKMLSNVEQVKTRGGEVIAIATEGDTRIRDKADWVIEVPGDAAAARAGADRACRCSCWPTTSRCVAAPMWTSRATWPRASRSSNDEGQRWTGWSLALRHSDGSAYCCLGFRSPLSP